MSATTKPQHLTIPSTGSTDVVLVINDADHAWCVEVSYPDVADPSGRTPVTFRAKFGSHREADNAAMALQDSLQAFEPVSPPSPGGYDDETWGRIERIAAEVNAWVARAERLGASSEIDFD